MSKGSKNMWILLINCVYEWMKENNDQKPVAQLNWVLQLYFFINVINFNICQWIEGVAIVCSTECYEIVSICQKESNRHSLAVDKG